MPRYFQSLVCFRAFNHGYISFNMDYCVLMPSSHADLNSDFTLPTITIKCYTKHQWDLDKPSSDNIG